MAEEIVRPHVTPSDFDQVRVVWRYELLKYLRSWRLIATLAIVGAILALIYLLPSVLGDGYSGTDSNVELLLSPAAYSGIEQTELGDAIYMGIIHRDTIEPNTIEVYLNGSLYLSEGGDVWVYRNLEVDGRTQNALLFMDEIPYNSTISVTYDWHVSAESFDSNFIGFVSILIVICATFFAADSLVGEFQNRTGYLIFPNALKREILLLGKFVASVTVGVVVVVLFYLVVAALSLVSARGVDDDFLSSLGFALLYLVAATGIGYFISSIMKGSTGAIVLTFFLLFMILPIVDGVSMVSGTKIEGSVTFAAGTISYILLDPYPVDRVSDEIPGMEFHNFYPTPATAAIVLLGYALVTCALSMVIFKRKQLAG